MTNTLIPRYRKAREVCAWFHLEDWSVVRVSGPDARDFLQRLGTADVRALVPGDGLQTLLLKGDGRLIADCAVLCRGDDDFLLASPGECRDELVAALDRFHFTEQLTITDLAAQYEVCMLSGPVRAETFDAATEAHEKLMRDVVTAEVKFAPASPWLMFLIPQEIFSSVLSAVYTELEGRAGVVGDSDLFHVLRIEDGVPLFGTDLTEKTIPLEAGQKPAISFTKGCFPGQEIVARINNLGHPARVLVGLALPETTDDLAGRDLEFEGKTVGTITSTAWSPALGGMLGMAYVKWNQRESGTVLGVSGAEHYQARVLSLPLQGTGQ